MYLMKMWHATLYHVIHLNLHEAKRTSKATTLVLHQQYLFFSAYKNVFTKTVRYLTTHPSSHLAMRHCQSLIHRSSYCHQSLMRKGWLRDILTMQRQRIVSYIARLSRI
jgi:hypothetical protein